MSGQEVEWRAVFEKPIEQFLYPSLQLFENDNYSGEQDSPASLRMRPELKHQSIGYNTNISGNGGQRRQFSRQSTAEEKEEDVALGALNSAGSSFKATPSATNIQAGKMDTDFSFRSYMSTTWQLQVKDKKELPKDATSELNEKLQSEMSRGEKYLRERIKEDHVKIVTESRALARSEALALSEPSSVIFKTSILRRLTSLQDMEGSSAKLVFPLYMKIDSAVCS